jgi:membrane protease YdiL (CAAX protease family)
VAAPGLGVHGASRLRRNSLVRTTAGGLPTPGRRVLGEEILVVLSLSLLPSAVDALFSLLEAPVSRTVAVGLFPSFALARQLISIVFGLAPAALVFHLVRRSGEGLEPFGLGTGMLLPDAAFGAVLAVMVSIVGLGLYLGAIALNVNRFVVPVPPLGHWWTIPILVLGAFQNGLLEEVIVVGYLIRRLEQLEWGSRLALGTSALLRATYHLYQGWGGFAGNLLLGVFFGMVFLRWRRTWPLVIAHGVVDILAGLAYIAFRGHCYFGVCVP